MAPLLSLYAPVVLIASRYFFALATSSDGKMSVTLGRSSSCTAAEKGGVHYRVAAQVGQGNIGFDTQLQNARAMHRAQTEPIQR